MPRRQVREWRKGMVIFDRVIQDVSPEFYGRILVKFQDSPKPIVYDANTVYLIDWQDNISEQ